MFCSQPHFVLVRKHSTDGTNWGCEAVNRHLITDDTRWFFDDDACTKVGDAYHNKPQRRWVAHYRGDTTNNGPVHWISENYVCPNCARTDNAGHKCCQNVPSGNNIVSEL